ncbi:hypothetical protein SADUNF_Sadunf06G0008200 [Salix dunnii]|uniref:Uncharacterized protein n=1 Tax=Salix dunnii TaxID=1413687 RepID=A0A835MUH9_9ROSI|nr:hypothetical protein SADUNF_Sadunf06G0008200 [Salix dunnii]
MALVLSINPLHSSTRPESNGTLFYNQTQRQDGKQRWATLQQNLRCNGRFTCLFSSSGREEQAKKALESALGGKKDEFEKWNKEIKKREEAGGGGDTGGGGWFGWGGRFGWSNGDNFWPEAQQTSLAVLGIIAMYLVVAKGDLILAVIFNPLLYALRGTRNGLTLISSKLWRNASLGTPSDFSNALKNDVYVEVSAKESVKRKWGSD